MVTITLDADRCTQCGKCIAMFDGYCITGRSGYPVFDPLVCNTCQKCVAICPTRAILVNGVYAEKIDSTPVLTADELERFLERRRSTKLFRDKPLSRDLVERIVASARYAPNQNKNITVHVVTDPGILKLMDESALRIIRRTRRVLFGFPPLTWFFSLFSRNLTVIRRKMDRDLVQRGAVLKKNAQAAIILTGDKRVPVTEHSAPYLLSTMGLVAQSLGVGSCLMDALLLSLRISRALRDRLAIRENVLGVMLLGYSAEAIVNIPRGYQVESVWHD